MKNLKRRLESPPSAEERTTVPARRATIAAPTRIVTNSFFANSERPSKRAKMADPSYQATSTHPTYGYATTSFATAPVLSSSYPTPSSIVSVPYEQTQQAYQSPPNTSVDIAYPNMGVAYPSYQLQFGTSPGPSTADYATPGFQGYQPAGIPLLPEPQTEAEIQKEKRKAQNREAQKAFRKRKEANNRELEQRLVVLEKDLEDINAEKASMQEELKRLSSENEHLRNLLSMQSQGGNPPGGRGSGSAV